MATVTMTMEEYLQLLNGLSSDMEVPAAAESMPMPKKRKSSAYSRRYKANFRKVSSRFKLKNGKWKKNGFKSAVKLAHKMSKK
uniref:Uncharacterized protein n=1 Tax=uncultured prokaryote TaxID=198431 RepID=A0A0H5Q7Y3_9ZZZZ|nr:hypothetical protein [uncultured prokaryote]